MAHGTTLVTGAAGCIGAWVVAALTARGIPVVVLDASENRRRLKLVMEEGAADGVSWTVGDVADFDGVLKVIQEHGVEAIIHLAALQVPFCKADPLNGARVNVVGTVAVFEAARQAGISRLVYASSVAAVGVDGPPATLYGVYKAADEGIARIYSQDWNVPSIGLRPHTVYGPGRDQGLTSAPTSAMVAAAVSKPFNIPFSGALQMQYTGEVADVFVQAVLAEPGAAAVFDLRGSPTTVEEIVETIAKVKPDHQITIEGEALPFPADFDDQALVARIGNWERVGLDIGVGRSISAFEGLVGRGLVEMP